MRAFYTMSALARSAFAMWALSLCLVDIVSALIAAVKKRYRYSTIALLLFAPAYLAWQVIFDLSLFGMNEGVSALCRVAGEWNTWLWVVALLVLSVGTVCSLVYNIRYEKNYITPGAIKVYLDGMPCGVRCWRENGRVLFSNIRMNELSVALTGAPLLNGNQFCATVSDGMMAIEDRMWRFVCRDIVYGGERLREMIASDVTTEYARTQALERDKAELAVLNLELTEYTRSIDETVRRQEILQAKVNIHDEMNRLMLSTVAAEGEDAETLDKIFALWQQNALLMCMSADETADKNAVTGVEKLAKALKVDIIWQGVLPATLTEDERSLFYSAAQEALINAAKHARATKLYVSVEETERGVRCRFTNDGILPAGEVRFGGGLGNLRRLAEEQGAVVDVEVGDRFALLLWFPVEK